MEVTPLSKKIPRKKSKKGLIVFLSILTVVIVGITVFAVNQYNNIKAISYMTRYTSKEREVLIRDNSERIDSIMERLPDVNVRPLTDDEEELLNSGEMSEADALNVIMGKDTESNPEIETETVGEDVKATAELKQEDGEDIQSKEKINELVARVYLLRSNFTGKINSLVEQAKAEFIKCGSSNALGLARKYMNLGLGLESECDGQIEIILQELSGELEKSGGDMSIIDDIKTAYDNEKSLKKAELIDKYKNR